MTTNLKAATASQTSPVAPESVQCDMSLSLPTLKPGIQHCAPFTELSGKSDAPVSIQTDTPLVKVAFRVPQKVGPDVIETLWGFDLGGDVYKLDNMPFMARSVSLGDIVYAPHDPEADFGFPIFERVVEKSGNRTLRVTHYPTAAPGDDSEKIREGLFALGCGIEDTRAKSFCVTIPPDVDYSDIGNYLFEHAVIVEHADPTFVGLSGGKEPICYDSQADAPESAKNDIPKPAQGVIYDGSIDSAWEQGSPISKSDINFALDFYSYGRDARTREIPPVPVHQPSTTIH